MSQERCLLVGVLNVLGDLPIVPKNCQSELVSICLSDLIIFTLQKDLLALI